MPGALDTPFCGYECCGVCCLGVELFFKGCKFGWWEVGVLGCLFTAFVGLFRELMMDGWMVECCGVPIEGMESSFLFFEYLPVLLYFRVVFVDWSCGDVADR
jgi:hypothetical protein